MLNGWIVKKLGMKQTVLVGVLIAAIFGMLPFIISALPLVFLFRFILGLGIGLFSPHAISLISLLYDGQKKATLLGLQVGITALGNAAFLLLASVIISRSWQSIYLLYGFLLVVFWLVVKFVPDRPLPSADHPQTSKFNISGKAFVYLVLCLWTFVIIYGVQFKIPTLLAGLPDGNEAMGGLTLSLMNLAGLFAGLSFGPLLKKFPRSLFVVGYLGAGLMVLLLALSTNSMVSMTSAVAFNFVYSFTGPFIILQLNTFTPKEEIVKINSLFSLVIIGSQFVSPLFWNTFIRVFAVSTNQLLMWIAALLGLTALVVRLTLLRKH
ncbi:hypothetical protein RV10_GL003884 [Enterococcus pallens]|nr:hypothetical protein RV10_GL003884 [Enterococcus pallens]